LRTKDRKIKELWINDLLIHAQQWPELSIDLIMGLVYTIQEDSTGGSIISNLAFAHMNPHICMYDQGNAASCLMFIGLIAERGPE
jgi:hypothetical protein